MWHEQMAFAHMIPAAVLLVILNALSSSASYASLYGPAGPNGFEANGATPRNLMGTTVFTGQASSAVRPENSCFACFSHFFEGGPVAQHARTADAFLVFWSYLRGTGQTCRTWLRPQISCLACFSY